MTKKKKTLVILSSFLGGAFVLALIAVGITLFTLIRVHIICLNHEWEPATCTLPQTCIYCDETEGNALGHTWNDATCTEASRCAKCNVSRGSALGHTWIDATCTTAKYCSVCNVSSGIANGHTWRNATCIESKTCSVCSLTDGLPLGHDWNDATCTEAKKCSNCNETEGSALGHMTYTEKDDYLTLGFYNINSVCIRCNEVISKTKEYYTTFISGNTFVFTCSEMMQRAEASMDRISGCNLTTGTKTVDDELYGCFWNTSGEAVGIVSFLGLGEDNILKYSSEHPRGIIAYADDENFVDVLWGIVGACDPTLDFEDIRSVCIDIITESQYELNGIRYIATYISGEWLIGVTIIDAVEDL